MAPTVTKETAYSFSLSTLVSIATLFGLTWVVVKPFITEAVAEELQEEIDAVKTEVGRLASDVGRLNATTSVALELVLKAELERLSREIFSLEIIKENMPETWTAADEGNLARLRADLNRIEQQIAGLANGTP